MWSQGPRPSEWARLHRTFTAEVRPFLHRMPTYRTQFRGKKLKFFQASGTKGGWFSLGCTADEATRREKEGNRPFPRRPQKPT